MLLETAAHGVEPKRSIVRVRDRGLAVRSGRIAAASLELSCSGTARMEMSSSIARRVGTRECPVGCWPIYAAAWRRLAAQDVASGRPRRRSQLPRHCGQTDPAPRLALTWSMPLAQGARGAGASPGGSRGPLF